MQHKINITVLNNAVGIPTSNDGVFIMFVQGVAITSTLAVNTLYLLTALADATALGITAAYDTANSLAVYQQISEYYAEAGTGALLWIVIVPTATSYATYVASATHATLIKQTSTANPLNRAKMAGYCYTPPSATQTANDFPVDVPASITAIQAALATLFTQGFQMSAILDGYNMSSTVTPSTIGTMATKAAASVSLCITGTQPNGVASVGAALGRFARIAIGHGFGAVKDGPRVNNTAFLTNGAIIQAAGPLIVGQTYTVYNGAITYNAGIYQPGQTFICVTGFTVFTTSASGYVSSATNILSLDPSIAFDGNSGLGIKQFMFQRTWMYNSGFFWNDGATCTSATLQLSSQEYNRVANALSADALQFFINEEGSALPIDTRTGSVLQGWLNAMQAQFYTEFIEPLNNNGGSGDLSDAKLIVTGPNFNSTRTLIFTLNIVPTVVLGTVNGTIQFTNTL
jgi:hypothetical protein